MVVIHEVINVDNTDILIEIIEIFLNTILYKRELYPKEIFEPRKLYNTLVYASVYPPLNTYIMNVLKSAKELRNNKSLQFFEIIIYKNEFVTYESYIFEISDNYAKFETPKTDRYFIDLEEQLRKSLLTFNNRTKILGKLPRDAKFKVHLTTTQSAFIKLSNDPKLRDFYWVQENDESLPDKNKVSILPITSVDSVGIQMYAECFQ